MTPISKVSIFYIFCLLGALHVAAVSQEQRITPVTRVVQLLQGIAKQIEKDGKVDESLYEDFVCWGKSIINQKTASIDASNSRINELKQYIADLKAGRKEYTTERSDCEKEIAEVMADMETMTAIRNKEHDDFSVAEQEMNEAIDALSDAIKTLKEATKDHKEGVLLAVKATLKGAAENGGMDKLAQRQESLSKAVTLGRRFLDKGDATFLARVLLGEVPEVDRKKLNRKATFKMAYKARSFKILDVLTKMSSTFGGNLADASKKERQADAEYKSLSSKKEAQLNAVRTSLNKRDSEKGQQGMFFEEAAKEETDLQKQVANDADFIEETRKALADKGESWKIRQELRAGELAAISKAISILHDNDSRDVFKKSYASQGFFLQVQQKSHKAGLQREQKATVALKDAAIRSGDKRLMALASVLSNQPSVKGEFDPIIRSIDAMLVVLQKEEDKDYRTKQICEDDRMKNTRSALTLSNNIDEMTDAIAQLATVIEETEHKIHDILEEYEKTKATLAEAKKMRMEGIHAFTESQADDKEAAKVVGNARDVLAAYYKEEAFLQTGKQPVSGMAAGEAPPPPPATWDGGYAKKSGEAQGIVAILDMIREDIKKDMGDAQADEKASDNEFQALDRDSSSQMKTLSAAKQTAESDLGRVLANKVTQEKMRLAEKEQLDSEIKVMKGIDPNCEYYEVNYSMRQKNRQIEQDGLNEAKAILKGGVFDKGPDPNREMKPGDASAVFLQKHDNDGHGYI